MSSDTLYIGGSKEFYTQLKSIKYKPIQYLKDAKKRAKNAGYNPNDLYISDDNKYKLMIEDDKGFLNYFGRVGYGDFLIYTFLENINKVPIGYAAKKRNVFQKSHSNIKGKWRLNRFSPNMLALNINW